MCVAKEYQIMSRLEDINLEVYSFKYLNSQNNNHDIITVN